MDGRRCRRAHGARSVTIASVLVVLGVAGCGVTSAPSAFEALPATSTETATTETTAPDTPAIPVPTTIVRAPVTSEPVEQFAEQAPATNAPAVQAPIPDPPKKLPKPTVPPKPSGPVTSFGGGTFVVGTDIVAGTYKAKPSGECYWARVRGTSDESDIIANHMSSGPSTVTISSSDGAFVSHRCGQWTKTNASLISTGPVTGFDDGTYVVGTDIESGTYKATPSGECYWARLRGTADEADIIANHMSSGPTTVTISKTDGAFVTHRCGRWTKIS